MEIQINFTYGDESLLRFPLEELARFVLEWEARPKNTEVSISFVSDSEIAELNERYRQVVGPTDVLSFVCDEEDEELYALDDDAAMIVLGDVVIAPDVALRQTQEYGTSFEEEINLLLVHGLLHLCGYDHIEDDEAEHMEALEEEILASWADR
ncbi:MAG: rRNA maturation RNase YbeY [Raoultibacter sp.]|jgi:probable rRNA maturation factor